VEFSRACGKTLREIFENIDKTRVGRITILSLRRKMEAEDIPATDEELDRMLNLYAPSSR
jgi:Ca2+-binding EF-hand superfamily protein